MTNLSSYRAMDIKCDCRSNIRYVKYIDFNGGGIPRWNNFRLRIYESKTSIEENSDCKSIKQSYTFKGNYHATKIYRNV